MAHQKALFVEVSEWEVDHLKQCLPHIPCEMFEGRLEDYKRNLADVTILSTFINSKIDKKALERLPHVNLLVTRSMGFDHIDVAECRRRRIAISYVPAYGESTVAEHAMALLLAISRKLPESLERTRTGQFDFTALRGFDLNGKILGIIGTGRIGLHVAKIAKGFGMTVIGFDAYPNKEQAEKIGLLYVTLDQLLKSSDAITLHLRLNKETTHIIGEDEFGKMKKGVILINTARGALIDTEAFLRALDDGTVKAAGLDVLEEENLLKEEHELLSSDASQKQLRVALENTLLLKRPNVLVTPHNAFNSDEAVARIIQTTADNIETYLAGHPQNMVTEQ